MRRKQNRRARVVLGLSLVSIAIPAAAGAHPGILSVPTASVSPLNVAALTDSASAVNAHPFGYQARNDWLAEGASLGVRRAERPSAQRMAAGVPPTPAASPRVAPSSGKADWYAIAACESGGRWDLNSHNGFWGGLQFLPSTWFAYGGGAFDGDGPFPYSAAQQIAVAERVLAGQGPGAWPNCFRWA
jgi:hypothetical protein